MRISDSTTHRAHAAGVAVAIVLKLVDAPLAAYFTLLGLFLLFWLVALMIEGAQELP